MGRVASPREAPHLAELHLVLREGAGLVGEDKVDLAELFVQVGGPRERGRVGGRVVHVQVVVDEDRLDELDELDRHVQAAAGAAQGPRPQQRSLFVSSGSLRSGWAGAHASAAAPDGHDRVEEDDEDDPLRKVVEARGRRQLEVPRAGLELVVLRDRPSRRHVPSPGE